jgi:XTP/dITP diphosphohydrolase
MSSVLLATRNAAKLAELRRLLASAGVGELRVLGLGDVQPFPEPPETEPDFEGNALLKARTAAQAVGLPAVADDSGLAVAALGGMPGVLSARWSGGHGDDEANLRLVLGQLRDVPDERRAAAFVCAAALVTAGGQERVLRREWHGSVTREPRGQHGFGYDPIFVPDGSSLTSGELEPPEKDERSHRGQALRALLPHLREL